MLNVKIGKASYLSILFILLVSLIYAQSIGLAISANWDSSESQIIVSIKNVNANSEAAYDVFAMCTNGFTQIGNSWRVSGLDVGSSQTVYLPISGSGEGTCTVKVQDVNNPNNYDSVNVPVQVSSGSIEYESGIRCSPMTLLCEQDNLYRCNAEGNDIYLIKECIQGCVFSTKDGGAVCIENNTNTDKSMGENFLYLLIIILVVLLIYFIIKSSKKKH